MYVNTHVKRILSFLIKRYIIFLHIVLSEYFIVDYFIKFDIKIIIKYILYDVITFI